MSMLFTVNDELIGSVTRKSESKNGPYAVEFQSAMDLFVGKARKGRRYCKQPIITATLANEDDWTGVCKLQYTKSSKGTLPRVTCTVSEKPDTDCNYPVYIVAIPFNGILDSIKPSNGYRIHRGFIGKAKRKEIKYGSETYTKVAFMVVTPNVGLLKKKNNDDSIDLEVVSYNLNSTESGESKTVKSTATISFTRKGVDFSIVTEDWHAVDPKKLDTAKNYIFPIYNGLEALRKRKADKNNTNNKKAVDRPAQRRNSEHLTQKINVPKLDDMIDKFNRDSSEKQAGLKKRNER